MSLLGPVLNLSHTLTSQQEAREHMRQLQQLQEQHASQPANTTAAEEQPQLQQQAAWEEHRQQQQDIQIIEEARDAVELAIEATREPAAEQLAQLTDEQKLAMCKPKSLGCQTPAGIQGAAIGTRLPKAVPSQAPRMAPTSKAAGTAQPTNAAAASTERSNVAAAPTHIHVELKPPPGAEQQRPKLKPGHWMNRSTYKPIAPPQRWRPPTTLRTKKNTSKRSHKSRSSSDSWGEWHSRTKENDTYKQDDSDPEGSWHSDDASFNAWLLLQKDAAAEQTAAQSSQDTAAQSSQDADDDDVVIVSGGAATADELAAVYSQLPDPDAEIQEELYSALSRSWLSRADVDPVLGTIGRHARTRGKAGAKPAAKVWMQRGKSTRAGSAL